MSRDLGLVVCLFVSFVQKVLPFGNYLHHHRIGFASPRHFFLLLLLLLLSSATSL